MNLTANDVARFWSKIDRSGGPDACWPWLASCIAAGYGQFSVGPANARRMLRSHRIAFALSAGSDAGDLCVCHRCDNRKCCNPAHLFLGSKADNTADMIAKGRIATGDRHGTHTHGALSGRILPSWFRP